MGDLRACLVPVRALTDLLGSGPAGRERVLELVGEELAPSSRPAPFGPIFARVPGTAVVHDDDPAPDDLDRLLGQDGVRPSRARATWRLVEAVAAALATDTLRGAADRPVGLAPLGLAVPEPDGLVVGSWTLAQARSLPSLSGWLDDALAARPAGSDPPEVVVFWRPGPTG